MKRRTSIWAAHLGQLLGNKHSDVLAVIRAGRGAKRRTRRRERHFQVKVDRLRDYDMSGGHWE